MLSFVATCLLLATLTGGEVILSAGIGGYNNSQLFDQLRRFETYSQLGAISGTSLLLYGIGSGGVLTETRTAPGAMTANEFGLIVKEKTGLPLYATIYCDESWGACSPLGEHLRDLSFNFTYSLLNEATLYGLDGFIIDLEPIETIPYNPTARMIEIAQAVAPRRFYVWVGDSTPMMVSLLEAASQVVDNLYIIAMNTYGDTPQGLVSDAQQLARKANRTLVGVLESSWYSGSDIQLICTGLKKYHVGLSIWASIINGTWINELRGC